MTFYKKLEAWLEKSEISHNQVFTPTDHILFRLGIDYKPTVYMTSHEMLMVVFFPVFYLSLVLLPAFSGIALGVTLSHPDGLLQSVFEMYRITLSPEVFWLYICFSVVTALGLTLPRLLVNQLKHSKFQLPESHELFYKSTPNKIEDVTFSDFKISA